MSPEHGKIPLTHRSIEIVADLCVDTLAALFRNIELRIDDFCDVVVSGASDLVAGACNLANIAVLQYELHAEGRNRVFDVYLPIVYRCRQSSITELGRPDQAGRERIAGFRS